MRRQCFTPNVTSLKVGIRTVAVEDGRILLNGHPIQMNGFGRHEGFYAKGFLIIDEIPAVSLQFEREENEAERLRACLQQIDELVTRDKNHPSVVMWSVANEPQPAHLNIADAEERPSDPSVSRGKRFLDTLLRRARELDPTRLVTLVP